MVFEICIRDYMWPHSSSSDKRRFCFKFELYLKLKKKNLSLVCDFFVLFFLIVYFYCQIYAIFSCRWYLNDSDI